MIQFLKRLFKIGGGNKKKEETYVGQPNSSQMQWNTYDNVYGSMSELIEHFDRAIIKGRELVNRDSYSVLKQLEEIQERENKQGLVSFVFKTTDPLTSLMENVFVLIKKEQANV